MVMKRNMLLSLALVAIVPLQAQVGKESEYEKMKKATQSQYEQFKQQSIQDYESFRQKANAEYAQFMEETWTSYNVMDGEALPIQPKPVVPLEHEAVVTNALIEYDEIEETKGLELTGQPEPIEPIIETFDANAALQSLSLYGSEFKVRVEPEPKIPIRLKNVSEKSVARMWKKLSSPYYDNIVAECLIQRKANNLCDWAYVKLTEQMAAKYFGADTNEAVVLQMYILVQSGYQMRIARVNDHLTLLMGSKEKIYQYKYTIMDGIQYYLIDRSMQNKSMLVFDRAFPQEKSLSLAMAQPKLSLEKTKTQTFKVHDYPGMEVTVETNKNLIDFYNDYPICGQWDYYSHASLSECVKRELYPALQAAVAGKTEEEAVNMLLNFVQTGFRYQTDEEQFGYERPLYPDEAFYYPYCDCEDRSILFSCLVRELTGLDVVLLSYPAHVTTAVRFNEPVEGDYLMVDGQKYVMCEPTFKVGVPVGYSAPNYRDKKPRVIRL